MMRWRAATLLLLWAGGACSREGDLPATAIVKPRVLAIKAEPPSLAPGESATVTALIVGTGMEVPEVSWARCRRAPRPGEAVNPDCVDTAQADYLEPIGEGPTITTTMPADVSADALGEPDASGGVYLPLVVRATVAGEVLVASYRLRLSTADSVNHNPLITELLFVAADGSATAIESGVPPTVQAGDRMTLRAALADGSTESYPAALGGGVATEMLLTSWFSSAGRFSHERSDGPEPTTVLELDANLPAAGNSIDLFAVTRDNRGGIDYVHRTLVFGQ